MSSVSCWPSYISPKGIFQCQCAPARLTKTRRRASLAGEPRCGHLLHPPARAGWGRKSRARVDLSAGAEPDMLVERGRHLLPVARALGSHSESAAARFGQLGLEPAQKNPISGANDSDDLLTCFTQPAAAAALKPFFVPVRSSAHLVPNYHNQQPASQPSKQ